MIKILIVDDNPDFRIRLRELLDSYSTYQIIGEANDGDEAVFRVRELKPDLVLMDVRMVGMNGLSSTQRIKDEFPDTTVIMLSSYDLHEYREAAKKRGASGYVVKMSMVEELHPTIQRVMAGEQSLKGD